ncbi:DUF2326 domain-containing protein [Lacipirellula parvula]|uniref:ATPase involved in DNA repair n=1 Tax=Lacipirellula parvula TaxID=2650471 RepID=A0A5K7X352_9BACT|nr:DUF2326 domain-containing protein [Lacipirellula parvula]BBO30765.1 ATPase involved in DNA repair [Lacipirellula parvula]
MQLSKLYSDRPQDYQPVTFVAGLNVVIAEIRLPENKARDTHNLGKSTLGRMLDFCFLADRDKNFFLFKYFDRFSEYCFFLEIQLLDGTFLTIRRSVRSHSRISFKRHLSPDQDYSGLPVEAWDHSEVPIERAQSILDGLLDWRPMKPWPYRKGLGYFLRSQDDFREVFQLRRFAAAHGDWKPFLAHLLGFDSTTITQHYQKEFALEEAKKQEDVVKGELGGSVEDVSKIDGILLLKRAQVDKTQAQLDAFDFRNQDKTDTKRLVEEIDDRIAQLNESRYVLSQSRKKVVASIKEDAVLFEPDKAAQLFKEAGILFEGQIKKDFEQLIGFNRAITEERRAYLEQERAEIDFQLKEIGSELTKFGKQRAESLAYLTETDALEKYKRASNKLIDLRADIVSLERQRQFISKLQELRKNIRTLGGDLRELQSTIEADVEKQNTDDKSLFSTIRLYFSDIVEAVIDRKALLSVSVNQKGHLEYKAEILSISGESTSADVGHTYRKLLCIAFDLALLRAYIAMPFPRFAYHDGVFESLDDRKKENLLSVLRSYAELGLQPVITLIDSDSPPSAPGTSAFSESEIVLRLHDEGPKGRLFMIESW